MRIFKGNYNFGKIDFIFLIILTFGIILRIISSILIPAASDAASYIAVSEGILNGSYNSLREPIFPLFIIPFLLIIPDSIVAIKIASMTSGILLIIVSYYVFHKASLKILKSDELEQNKSKIVGLLVSLSICFNLELIYNNGLGLREETISLLLVLVFYFVIVKKDGIGIKHYLILILVIMSLTLIHLTVGIFTNIAIFFFFLISKTRYAKYKLPNVNFLIIFLSFIISLSFWFIFCLIRFGDPFYTLTGTYSWFESYTYLNLNSIEGILQSIRLGVKFGLIMEFSLISRSLGYVFTFLILLSFFYYYKKPQILILGIIIAFNFLYLSVFIAFYTDIRYLLYFLPFLFFLSFLLIIDIVYKKKEKITVTFNLNSKQLLLSFNLIFIILLLYITTNSLFQICSFILRLNLIQGELLYNFSYFTQYMKISLGITLTALLLLPFYGRDRTKEGEIHFERRLSKKSIFLVIIFIILIIYFFIWLQ